MHGEGNAEERYQQARHWLDERLALHPENDSHWSWLSVALSGLGESDSAEQVLRRRDQVDPGRARTRGQLAALAARRGDTAAAERWLAGLSAHQLGIVRFQRARVAALMGDESAALQYLEDALRVGVDNWHWHLHEAWRDLAPLHDHPRFVELVGATQVQTREA